MKLENVFEVPVAPEEAWELFQDVPRVVPCLPGAELTKTIDDDHWKATMKVKLGPVALTFLADVSRDDLDVAARSLVLSATAREARGRGSATATIRSSLTAAGEGTRVDVVTDLVLSGAVAQYGRGIIDDVSAQLLDRFATCLQSQFAAPAPPAPETATAAPQPEAATANATPPKAAPEPPTPAAPVSALSLLLGVLRRRLRRLFGRGG